MSEDNSIEALPEPTPAASSNPSPTPVTLPAGATLTADGKAYYVFKPIPSNLLSPPGMVGAICAWINSTAIYPQPVLALANALSLWGAVIGRKVCTATDLRSNLYTIGIADSGAGKDHSRRQTKKLVASAGLNHALLGGEEIASHSALLKSLKARPSELMQLDELGHLLASWNSKNAANYQMLIPSTLMKIYTSANTLLLGTEYATQERTDIYEPNLCIYGTSVPEQFYTNLRPEQIEDGLLGRFDVFETNNHSPEPHDVDTTIPPPVEVAQRMRMWHERQDLPLPAALAYEPGDLEMDHPTYSPIVVPATPEATHVFQQFVTTSRVRREQLRGNNGLGALWVRAGEHAQKIALIIACGCAFDRDELEITEEHALFATRLVKLLINNTIARVMRHVHENVYEKNLKRILMAIQKVGLAGCTRSQILRQHQHIRGTELTEILDRLVETGQIRRLPTSSGPQGGRPAEKFVAAQFDGA
jgi:hypothetical protein